MRQPIIVAVNILREVLARFAPSSLRPATHQPTNGKMRYDVRKVRDSLKLTQAQLAARIGVSRATVNRWERGRTRPLPAFSQRLSQLHQSATPH